MPGNDRELLDRLLATFQIEADEQVKAMAAGLLRLEKRPSAPDRSELIDNLFRSAHSLKGAARAVKHSQIESLCQPLEEVLSALKDGRIALPVSLCDQLHRAVDLIGDIATSGPDSAHARQADVAAVIRSLGDVIPRGPRPRSSDTPSNTPTRARPITTAASTVRVLTEKLDRIMRQVEELLVPKLASRQRAEDIALAVHEVGVWRRHSVQIQGAVRGIERAITALQIPRHPELRKLLEHVAEEEVRLRAWEDRLAKLGGRAEADLRQIAALTDGMQQLVKEIQVQPWSTLLELFAREARDIARAQGKEVNLAISGGAIEVDRRLLDEMRDPLIHLVRNCIDHGIERPESRRAAGKPEKGFVDISVAQIDGGKVTLVIGDDGSGIDVGRLTTVAAANGLRDADELDEDAALELVFQSGLSTSPVVTEVSGRGLGLAIVRERVEQLGGNVVVSSRRGQGTKFTISLPVALATFRGTQVVTAGTPVIIPSANIDRVVRVDASALDEQTSHATLVVEDLSLPFVWLCDVLELPRVDRPRPAEMLAVVLGRGATRVAFGIDEVVAEQEVLVRPLGPLLRRVRNIAGASVLGDGRVVTVVNVSDLLATAALRPHPQTPGPPAVVKDSPAQHWILVAEDSITSRALMKDILESVGYHVVTATDGIDAFTALKTRHFDLVVSDVDMPRMSGIELTAKLRTDRQLADLPVILVTTMNSKEDRERGVDAGANAYIVKSSFDQSNLIETIRRLI